MRQTWLCGMYEPCRGAIGMGTVSGRLVWVPWWPYGRDVVGARMYAMADAGVALYVQPAVPELYLPYR